MSSFAAASLVIGALLLVGVPILWLIFRSGVDPASNAQSAREFERRLRAPDFLALERSIGVPLPPAVTLLYGDHPLVLGDGWRIAVANEGQGSPDSYLACFQPADLRSLRALGGGDARWLAFANDGTGDEYLVDLRQSDPDVIYLRHETGERFPLGVTLAQFIGLPRRVVGAG